jgi:hypothetical protein
MIRPVGRPRLFGRWWPRRGGGDDLRRHEEGGDGAGAIVAREGDIPVLRLVGAFPCHLSRYWGRALRVVSGELRRRLRALFATINPGSRRWKRSESPSEKDIQIPVVRWEALSRTSSLGFPSMTSFQNPIPSYP